MELKAEGGTAEGLRAKGRPAAGRALVFGFGSETSGIPLEWAATARRPDLGLMYFPEWNPVSGALAGMRMTPMRTRRFQKVKSPQPDSGWLAALMNSEGKRFGTRVERGPDDVLTLRWE